MDYDERREAAMRRAGTVLARRARSEAELTRSLAPVAPPEVVEGVVDDLRALGYVDDTALACALAERRLESGWGTLRVQADLERLEIEGEAARAGIAVAAAGERQSAQRLLALRRIAGDPRRAASLLARRGFGEDVAEALLGLGPE
jgi:regulatory protein